MLTYTKKREIRSKEQGECGREENGPTVFQACYMYSFSLHKRVKLASLSLFLHLNKKWMFSQVWKLIQDLAVDNWI
jgi:hypothetical protein